MKIFSSLSELIGETPMLQLKSYTGKEGIDANMFAKLELFNPAGSSKDRIALRMIEKAEEQGRLKAGSAIIEPTSGNTGIGIAAIAASKGYRAIIVLPDSMSRERISLMRAYGAEVVLTPGALGMAGAVEKAEGIHRSLPDSMIAGQFENPANPEAHKTTTAPEIWEDCDGKIDAFVCGVGTGGTITGVGEYLKEKNPDIKIIAVEPASSPLLSQGHAGAHGIQGIGANFVPSVLNTEIIDEIICVSDSDAFEEARKLAKCEGVLVGISSGAALFAAAAVARRPEYSGKNIVVLLPDTGERYLSSGLFDN